LEQSGAFQLNPTITDLPSASAVKPTDLVIVETDPNTSLQQTSKASVSNLVGGTRLVKVQSTPSTTWVINHNLGYYPNIQTLEADGREFIGDVVHIDLNTAQVSFTRPKSGLAVVG
jgi:hypothetical protein